MDVRSQTDRDDNLPTTLRSIQICNAISDLNMTPKSFLQNMIDSDNDEMIRRRQYWGTETGWKSTERLVLGFKRLVLGSTGGEARWEQFILKEAKEIVNQEDLPKGIAPTGAFYSSDSVEPDFFSEEAEHERYTLIRTRMPFLHNLIHSKIEMWNHKRDKIRLQRKESLLAPVDELFEDQRNGMILDDDQSSVEALEGISHSVELEPDQLDGKRLEQIPVIVLSMIAFACNRRFNGLQLQNSLAFVACGVSERMNDYLAFIGLASSRKTALRVMDSLGDSAAKEIKSRVSKAKDFRPSMILDNIDIQTRIHTARIESTTKMFHGSYGYLHFIPKHLIKDLNAEDFSTENLLKYTQESQKEAFDLKYMLPNQIDNEHWALVRKSQLANAMISYVLNKDSPAQKACGGRLKTSPPSIDQIELYEPDLLMLKMMSASDGSAAGVSELLDQCKRQMGEDLNASTKSAQIIEGDMGTCLNFESLIRQRFPAGNQDENLNEILNLPGLAHTLWNIASKVLSHHWGDSKDSSDTGVHRTTGALGMEASKLPSQKDFNSLMQVIHKSHMATLVFLLKQTLELHGSNLNLEDSRVVESVIDECYDRYFTLSALRKSKDAKDWTTYNMQLRLRDFASIVEGDNAMRAGDIGRVMNMWKRWALMAQGLSGLSHYAIHLPRFIMILEKFLPKKLSRAIKHSLLIPPGGRAGHWVAKDFWLEIQNYWLKYFYNNLGQGTKIERLMERFSIIIPLVLQSSNHYVQII